jgi:rRNA maturation endonuclease Nob1
MLLSVAVVLVVGTLLFTLFVRSQDVPEAPVVSPAAHLEERKAQIYENLRDLQFEFRLGKLSDADYQKTKVDLQRELAKVLAEIDAVQPAAPAPPVRAKAAKAAADTPAVKVSDKCPHCGAKFPQPLKFCGECGKAMA